MKHPNIGDRRELHLNLSINCESLDLGALIPHFKYCNQHTNIWFCTSFQCIVPSITGTINQLLKNTEAHGILDQYEERGSAFSAIAQEANYAEGGEKQRKIGLTACVSWKMLHINDICYTYCPIFSGGGEVGLSK